MTYIIIILLATCVLLGWRLYVTTKILKKNELPTLIDLSQPDADNEIRETFLKFISDSREWAFGYIEKTQESLVSITHDMSNILEKDSLDIDDLNALRVCFTRIRNMLPQE